MNSKLKKIFKNALSLYIRMFLTMAVALWTSRVVLNELGVESYGLYNIVAGIVVAISFVNNSLLGATQRFLSYEIGNGDKRTRKVFSSCLLIHGLFAICLLVLAETIGLWFLNNKVVLPDGARDLACIIYHMSVLVCSVQILTCPFNALLLSRERMGVYAYIGIMDSVVKLLIAYLLIISDSDKLLLYAVLMTVSHLLTVVITVCYTWHISSDARWKKKNVDRRVLTDIFHFAKWTLAGSIANMSKEQGLNIICNLFYGVAINASVGIANRVNGIVTSFVSNFQLAFNPQLTKLHAEKDSEMQSLLINLSSRYSFFLCLLLVLPAILLMDRLLVLWLGIVPMYTAEICTAMLLGILVESLSNPLWVTIFANGNVKTYQIVISIILLTSVPIAYLLSSLDFPAYFIYIIRSCVFVVAFLYRVFYLVRHVSLNLFIYAKEVIIPVILVSCLTIIPAIIIKTTLLNCDTGIFSQITVSFVFCIYSMSIVFYLGLNQSERERAFQVIMSKLKI